MISWSWPNNTWRNVWCKPMIRSASLKRLIVHFSKYVMYYPACWLTIPTTMLSTQWSVCLNYGYMRFLLYTSQQRGHLPLSFHTFCVFFVPQSIEVTNRFIRWTYLTLTIVTWKITSARTTTRNQTLQKTQHWTQQPPRTTWPGVSKLRVIAFGPVNIV